MKRPLRARSVIALSAELGVGTTGLTRHAHRLGIEIEPLKRRSICGDSFKRGYMGNYDAALLVDDYQARSRPASEIGHWLRSGAAAAALGLSVPALYQRHRKGTLKIECFYVLSGKKGQRRLYNPEDVKKEAKRLGILPRKVPRGAWSTNQMVEALGMATRGAAGKWAEKGCPFHLTISRRRYWRPAEVETWLALRPDPAMDKYKRRFLKLREAV